MSFSWRGLLGVGSSSATSGANGTSTANEGKGAQNGMQQWVPEQLDEEMPLWGLENFGNTCYANSVLQPLYFCRPFRDAILAYAETHKKALEESDKEVGSSSRTTVQLERASSPASHDTSRPRTGSRPRSRERERLVSGQSDGKAAAEASQSAPVEPDTVFLALGKLFASITDSSSQHLANHIESASSATGQAQGKTPNAAATGKGSKASKLSSSVKLPSQPARPSSAISPGAASQVPGSKQKDPGISAGPADAASVRAFLAAVRRTNALFDTNAHQDAHEFLNILLNRLGDDLEDLLRKKNGGSAGPDHVKTLIHKLFEGVLTNETRCLTCEAVSSRDECFLDLSIDIENNSSVTSCLRQFSASETLRSRNKFFCDTCSGLQEAEKRMKVRKLPAVLALHLKRFKFEESTQRFVKLACRVLFPLELRLFNTTDDADDPDRLYELFGIVVHIGAGPHHGHYVSIIKVGNKWALFDDEAVHFIEQLDISRYFGGTPGMGSAYVLFYQAVDLDREKLGLPAAPPPTALEVTRAKMMSQAATAMAASSSGGTVDPNAESAPASSRLHVPFTRSPADSVSSSGNAPATSSSAGQSIASPKGDGPPLGGPGSGAATPVSSSVSGLFSRRRGESTSTSNSLSQAAENTRNAVDAAARQSGGSGGWRSSLWTRAGKRSGSVSDAPSQHASLSSDKKMSDSMTSDSALMPPTGITSTITVSPSESRSQHEDDHGDSMSMASTQASATGRQTGTTQTSMSSSSTDNTGNVATPSMLFGRKAGDGKVERSPSGRQPVLAPSSAIHESPASSPAMPRAAPLPSSPLPQSTSSAASEAGPSRQFSGSSQDPRFAATLTSDPEATVASEQAATSDSTTANAGASAPAQAESTAPSSSSSLLQTTAFAPVGRVLSKREQQKFAKHARKMSLSGAPAGIEDRSGNSGPVEDGQAVTSDHRNHGNSEVDGGIPSSSSRWSIIGRGQPSTAPESATSHKRRSTLSRAFGIGKKS